MSELRAIWRDLVHLLGHRWGPLVTHGDPESGFYGVRRCRSCAREDHVDYGGWPR